MSSALKPNHTFLGSPPNSARYFLSIFLHCEPSVGCLKFPSFLRSSLCHCELGMLFISEQTFQPWHYRSIPHHLGRNPLPGGLAVNITKVISSDLIPQCTAYRACVQILVRTAVEDAVIRACMYLLHLQSYREYDLLCCVRTIGQFVILWKPLLKYFQYILKSLIRYTILCLPLQQFQYGIELCVAIFAIGVD